MGNKADKKKRKKKCDREDHPDRPPQTKNTVLKKISPKRKDNPNSKDKSGQASNSAKKEQKETVKKKIKEKADAKGGEGNWEGKSEKSGKSEPSAKKAKDALKSIKTAKSVKSKANEGKHKDKSDRCKPKSKQTKENKAPVGTGKHSQSADKPKENDTVAGYEKSIISSQTAKQEVYPPQSPKSNTAQRPAAATNAKKKKKKKIKNIDKLKKSDKKKKPKEPKPTSKEKRDHEVGKSPKNQVPDPPLVIAEVTGQTQPKESSVKSKTIEMTLADKDDTVGLPTTKQNQDQAMGSLDSQIELDLGKSDGSPKSDGLSGQDEDQAYADERLNPIFKEEFEHLYEKLKTLNRAVLTLKESYRDHIRSLVKLSKQTGEERTAVNSDDESVDEKKSLPTNMLINISDLKTTISEGEGGGGKERKTKKDTDITTRYRLDAFKSDVYSTKVLIVDSRFDMAHFLDPRTRENTFRDLFNEVGSLNDSLNRLKDFYDSDGDFMIQEYETSDYRISRNTFDTVRQKTQMLLTIVQKVTRIYNQDLLDMFRIKS